MAFPGGASAAKPRPEAKAHPTVTHRSYTTSKRVAAHRVGTVNPVALARADLKRRDGRAATAGNLKGRDVPLGAPPSARRANAAKSRAAKSAAAKPAVTSFAGNVKGASGFDGITSAINGGANSPASGGVGDVSPPDQGLAVGPSSAGTAVVEFVNQSFDIYSTKGRSLLGAIPSYQLFGLPASSFLSDPRAYYDAQTGHWFLTMFTSGTVTNGTLTAPSTQYVDVSQTTSPFGPYTTFSFDTTDATHANCPCFGDYDQIGANKYGFYISTNEFSLLPSGAFNGANIYSASKQELVAAAQGNAAAPTFQLVRVPSTVDPYAGYHLAPSAAPPGQANPADEYFVESNANTNYGNGLEVFSLLGTSGLAAGGKLTLTQATVPTQAYSTPPNAYQKSGPNPYGQSLGGYGVTPIETDFDAVQEVTYAGGNLYAELNTGFSYGTGQQSAAAWFVLHPKSTSTSLSATLIKDGTVKTNQFLLYPDIAVNANGMGYLAFAVSGTARYPSAGYVAFDGTAGAKGPVHIAAKGVDPLDDFTCYKPYGPACRYGDYSAGQSYNGKIYMATEYIAPQPRDVLSNWGTRVWDAPAP